MALVTRCSNAACLTLFRVTPAQLQAFGGQVRCGTCGTVFDAFPSLATVADAALRTPDTTAPVIPAVPPDDPLAERVVEWAPEGPTSAADVHDGGESRDSPAASVESIEPIHRVEQPVEQPVEHRPPAGQSESVGQVDQVEPVQVAEVADPIGTVERVGTAAPVEQFESVETGEAVGQIEPNGLSESLEQDRRAGNPPGLMDAPERLDTVDRRVRGEPVEQQEDVGPSGPQPPFDADADGRMQSPFASSPSVERADPGTPDARSADPARSADLPVGESPDRLEREAIAPASAERSEVPVADLDVPPPATQSVQSEPVPAFAPELTDYSVTPGPPLRTPAAKSRRWLTSLGWIVLILAAASGAAWFFRDRLPAPLDSWLGRFPRALPSPSPLLLLREYGVALAALAALAVFALLRRYRLAWIVLAAILVLLLSGQLLYAYRTQVAAFAPAARPALERLCTLIGCEVGLPTAPAQLVIEASDLQALDAARPNLIQLSATVRNRASIDVAFPAIEVTLTDAQDKPVARRVLMPEQYLERKPDNRVGLRAGEEFSVRLTLDTTELRPVGYRLYLFYP